jgi:hypothetical protein
MNENNINWNDWNEEEIKLTLDKKDDHKLKSCFNDSNTNNIEFYLELYKKKNKKKKLNNINIYE